MAKLDTSHLVLKPVLVNGKLQHRWINPNNDEEHAPHGSKITFEHHGKEMTGTVGSVIKSGEYAVKGDNGTVYNKHKHQFTPVKEIKGTVKETKTEVGDTLKEFDQKQLENFIAKTDKFLDEWEANAYDQSGENYVARLNESKLAKTLLKERLDKQGNLINTKGDFHVKIVETSTGKFKYEGKLPIDLTVERKDDQGVIRRVSPVFTFKEDAVKAIDKFNKRQAEELIESEKLNRESTTADRVLNGFKNSATGYPVIDAVLTGAIPHLENMVARYRKRTEEEGRVFNARFQTSIELELVKDLVGALGNYIKKTDDIKNLNFKESTGTVAITASIIRDGKPNFFSTQMIIAGGYNIQVAHYRYLVDTKLPSVYNSPLKAIEAKIKHMKAEDKIKADINIENNLINRYQNDLKTLESKTKEQVFQEEEDRHIKLYGGKLDWDRLAEDAPARKNYTKEEWNQRWENDKERAWENISSQIKSAKYSIKEIEKKKSKLETKLAEHLKEEAKWESPNEGDMKVERGRKDYRNTYPIHIHVFKDGNFKHLRSTTTKNIRAEGFDHNKDEEVLKYHAKKLAEKSE